MFRRAASKSNRLTIRTTQVEIGELSKKDVEIRCKVVGNVAEGYIAGTIQLLPETLEVRGQQTDIMQISYAQITLDIEDATATVVKLLDYTPLRLQRSAR